MTASLEWGEWSASRPGRTLPPGNTRYPLYRRLDGPQGRSGRAEHLAPPGFDPRTVQPLVSRYADWATRPTINKYIQEIVSRAKIWSVPMIWENWYSVWTAISCNYIFPGTKAEIKYICQWKGISAVMFVYIGMFKKAREVHWIYPCWVRAVISGRRYIYSNFTAGSTVRCSDCHQLRKIKRAQFTFMWPCIVINLFSIKPTRCTNISNVFLHKTLHVSGSSSSHHQESLSVNSALVCVMHGLTTAYGQGPWPCP